MFHRLQRVAGRDQLSIVAKGPPTPASPERVWDE